MNDTIETRITRPPWTKNDDTVFETPWVVFEPSVRIKPNETNAAMEAAQRLVSRPRPQINDAIFYIQTRINGRGIRHWLAPVVSRQVGRLIEINAPAMAVTFEEAQ